MKDYRQLQAKKDLALNLLNRTDLPEEKVLEITGLTKKDLEEYKVLPWKKNITNSKKINLENTWVYFFGEKIEEKINSNLIPSHSPGCFGFFRGVLEDPAYLGVI